jgi:hypothetical protein
MLSLRAQANRHCRAVIFRAEVDEADAAAIKWLLDAERHNEALIKLKECAKKVQVRKGMQKSWTLIPNNDLDRGTIKRCGNS